MVGWRQGVGNMAERRRRGGSQGGRRLGSLTQFAGGSAFQMADALHAVGATQEAARWAEGGLGEKIVARELERLPQDAWSFWHDAQISRTGANVDHVLVGPPGVFCLDAKNLTGAVAVYPSGVYVNREPTDYAQKAVAAACAVRERLRATSGVDAFVHPVLVLVNQVPAFFGNDYVGAFGHKHLVPALLQLPPMLDARKLHLLRAAVRNPETWRVY